MMWNLAAILMIGSTACAKDAQGYCTDKVVHAQIAYKSDSISVKINCALGDVVSISLPPDVEFRGEPALGNQAIFEFKAETDPFRILVWPKLPASAKDVAPDALLGERSNMQIFLDSGITLLVELKIGRAEKSVEELRFEFPERAKETEFVKEHTGALAKKLEEEFRAKARKLEEGAEAKARHRIARAILERVQCAALSSRKMVDLLVVRAHRVCRIGDLLFVEFSIQNRAKDVFHLLDVHLGPDGTDEADTELASVFEYSGETTLAFDQEVRGVGAFTLGESISKGYALTIRESGGKKRSITLDGVEF
jgi:hypothetical protein